jgi:hypothetical protein
MGEYGNPVLTPGPFSFNIFNVLVHCMMYNLCLLKHASEDINPWQNLFVCFQPGVKLVDPICTFLFSLVVLATTIPVLRDASHILMEGFPRHLDYTAIANSLRALDGVRTVHNLHVWSLTLNKSALAVHLAIGELPHNVVDRMFILY